MLRRTPSWHNRVSGLAEVGPDAQGAVVEENYQLVAENSGQSPKVLMSNYNEALDSEKRTLSHMVETSFYPQAARESVGGGASPTGNELDTMLQAIRNNPELSGKILQALLLSTVLAQQNIALNC